jgi:hypothetical protein
MQIFDFAKIVVSNSVSIRSNRFEKKRFPFTEKNGRGSNSLAQPFIGFQFIIKMRFFRQSFF